MFFQYSELKLLLVTEKNRIWWCSIIDYLNFEDLLRPFSLLPVFSVVLVFECTIHTFSSGAHISSPLLLAASGISLV